MVGRDNKHQFDDLLRRLLRSGRPTRFVDYWGKSPDLHPKKKIETGVLREIPKDEVKKKRGRPLKGGGRMNSGRPEMSKPTADTSPRKA